MTAGDANERTLSPTGVRAARVARVVTHLRAAYLEADPRSLGLVRIALGLLLLGDLIRHVGAIRTWFAEDGVMPVPWIERLEPDTLPLSVLLLVRSTPAIGALFVMFAVIYAAYTVGYRTPIAQVLAFAAAVSLHGRVDYIEHSGERALHIVLLVTTFLPLGRRFSFDALRAREAPTAQVPSIAVAVLLVQLALIYALDWAVKSSSSWRHGTALMAAIGPEIGSPIGLFLRDAVGLPLFRPLGYLTLAIEVVVPVLLLVPLAALRLLAVVLMVALQLGIWVCFDLGVFQPSMIAAALFFVPHELWDALGGVKGLEPLRVAAARAAERLAATMPARTLSPPAPPHRALRLATEAAHAAMGLVLVTVVLGSNESIPEALRPPRPVVDPLRRALYRVGIFESWLHFNSPRFRDTILIADAVTKDGRHVDPISEAALGERGPPPEQVPRRRPTPLFWTGLKKYTRHAGSPVLEPLGEWIERYPARTGDPADELIHWKIVLLTTERNRDGAPLETTRAVLAEGPGREDSRRERRRQRRELPPDEPDDFE